VTAVAAMLLNAAVPMAPPICCAVFAVAEATPWSRIRTPRVARLNAEGMARPIPAPSTAGTAPTERGSPRTASRPARDSSARDHDESAARWPVPGPGACR
jgi:hypothetical protein